MSLLMHPKYKSDCNGNLYRNQQIQVNENACTGGASDNMVFRYGGSAQVKRQGEICVWIWHSWTRVLGENTFYCIGCQTQ